MEGFINLLKPKGITSHDAVLEVRRLLGKSQVGHIGTLDPGACGVLPLVVGSSRKLAEYLQGEDKDYLAEFTFGISTDTGDSGGRLLVEKDAGFLKPADVLMFLPHYTGQITQVPPMYSAVKVKGKKLYELARLGIKVEIPVRKVFVYKFEMLSWIEGQHPRALFALTVGGGTYIRSLASSLGEDLGVGASVSFLLRSRVGSFSLKDSVTIETVRRVSRGEMAREIFLEEARVLPGDRIFPLKKASLEKVKHGVPLAEEDFEEPEKVMSWLRTAKISGEDGFTSKKTGNPVFFASSHVDTRAFPRVVCILSFGGAPGRCTKIVYEKVLI